MEASGTPAGAPQFERASGSDSEPSPASLEAIAVGSDVDRQRSGGFDARIGLGFALPVLSANFIQAYTPGYLLSAEAGWQLGTDARYHLALTLGHGRFFLSDPSFASSVAAGINDSSPSGATLVDPANVDSEGGSLVLTELLAQLRWDMATGQWRPFLLGAAGAALFLPRVARYTVSSGATAAALNPDEESRVHGEQSWDDDLAPLLSVGIGLTDPAGPFGLYAQCRFNWAIASDTEARWVAVSVGAEL